MIQAVIFDMDGLLIDSEPLWTRAEIAVMAKAGVKLTPKQVVASRGLRTDEKVRFWYQQFPWDEKMHPQKAIADDLIDTMVDLLSEGDLALPGVYETVAQLEEHGLPMAIASSSPQRIIDAVMHNLDIHHKMRVIYSAQYEEYGKPHPGVYITAAKKLGIAPEACLAFEDSINGVLSAKAAKMKCIAIPEAGRETDNRFNIADITLHSLLDFTPQMLEPVSKIVLTSAMTTR
jgi:HAD superfamily hydrolase (TIGR01509 family)